MSQIISRAELIETANRILLEAEARRREAAIQEAILWADPDCDCSGALQVRWTTLSGFEDSVGAGTMYGYHGA